VKKIRTLIIQSFPDVRAALREMIAMEKDLVLLGECDAGESGVQAIRKYRPQLLFLGVQLRGMDGFDVLHSTNGYRPPAIIFVSKFEKYAVRAFRSHAVDYLLKPFTRARFREALMRSRSLLRSAVQREQKLEDSNGSPNSPKLLGVKVRGRIVLLKPAEIEAIVARRAFSTLHTTNGPHRARTSLSAFQSKLPSGKFIRINRSTLINADHIKTIARKSHGDGLLRMTSGKEFPLSRRYREKWHSLIPKRDASPPRPGRGVLLKRRLLWSSMDAV